MNLHRSHRLLLAVAAVVLMSWASAPLAMAQGSRLRLGPSLRAPDRDKKSADLEEPSEPSDAESPEAEPSEAESADRSPGAQSYAKGVEAFEKGETDAAIALMSRAIQLDPKYAPAYCDRGLALVIKGDLDKAVTDLNTAIRLAPSGERSYFNRGFAYFHKGDYDKAVADYTEAIRLQPGYAEAYRDRGYVAALKGDFSKALADLGATWKPRWPTTTSRSSLTPRTLKPGAIAD
jgi:tetratricopeptide (TPR) repeat protein